MKWEYLEMLYAADKSYGELRLLQKITEEHVKPEKMSNMRVKTAVQTFSHSVAVATEDLTGRGDLPIECRQMIDIVILLDNLFDSMNSSTFHIPNGKIYKGPIRRNSPHHQLWVQAKNILKTVKFVKKTENGNKIRNVDTTVPSVKNFIKTIEGMEALWIVLSRKYSFDTLLTRHFNQDPIENFFGNIRSYGARNNAPNSISFEGGYKALLINNYNSPHSLKSNYTTIKLLIYSWCRSVNRILAGRITYDGEDETKLAAKLYYEKHKHNKNKK
ncbi:unnamed protein product [Euphydryas editha]|uniref:Uncharacterized protein n=1 Tax=Euphydryas editha TaxID=104508 RepID=A0AAU9VET7_EUPED|nr:unnamed protein product [Euphydryas editha]